METQSSTPIVFALSRLSRTLNRVRDPILLVLGGQDPKVSLSDADEFVRRLRRRKQDVSLEIVPALGHKTETPDEISLADARIVDFFAEKLDANTGLQ